MRWIELLLYGSIDARVHSSTESDAIADWSSPRHGDPNLATASDPSRPLSMLMLSLVLLSVLDRNVDGAMTAETSSLGRICDVLG